MYGLGGSKLIWVVNLRIVYGYVISKWKIFYRGGNGAHFCGFLGFRAVALSNLKIFSWDSGYPSVYLLWTYFGQYQLDLVGHKCTWMHGCISGLILHGAFQTKFLGILYHKLSTFMLIRRGAGSFKCYFWIFEILENFLSWFGAMLWYYCEDMHLDFSVISWTFSEIFLLKKGLMRG